MAVVMVDFQRKGLLGANWQVDLGLDELPAIECHLDVKLCTET